MKILLLVLHLITALSLTRMLWWMKLRYKLPINFYNLPIILMFIMGNILLIYLSIYKFILYVPTAILCSIVFWNLIPNVLPDNKTNLTGKIIFSIICGLIWPEMLTFVIFYYYHSDKIEADGT